METQTHSYRLERWIAFFLALLFLLPFVANADDLLAVGSFHDGDVTHRSGEPFLALVEHGNAWMLQPVHIRVTREYDPIVDEPHQMTGMRVEAAGIDDAFLLRGARLAPGHVQTATPHTIALPLHETTSITFNRSTHRFSYQCSATANEFGEFDCALLLDGSEPLATFPATPDEKGALIFPDIEPAVLFAGDLDRDGKMDFLINIAGHYNHWAPALFLSTAAAPGTAVKQSAMFSASGC